MKKEKGSLLILLLPVTALLFCLALFVMKMEEAAYLSAKGRVLARATLVSTLRTRVEGLQKIAEKAQTVAAFFSGGDDVSGFVPSTQWAALKKESDALVKAIPGYKGRITASLKVVAEANDITKGTVEILKPDAHLLGVVSQGQWIVDENGQRKFFPGIWVQRQWDLGNQLGIISEKSRYKVTLQIRNEIVSREAERGIEWDVPMDSTFIQHGGNGGFPRSWPEALQGNQIQPYRFPYYWVSP